MGDWNAKRKNDSLDSSLLREKGVGPAWSIDQKQALSTPFLVGDTASSMMFCPDRPKQAQTPFDPPFLSSLGHQVNSVPDRLKQEPAFTFYGPYSDLWGQEHIDRLKGPRGSKAHGVFAGSVGGMGVSSRGPATAPGPGKYDVSRSDAMGAQTLSTRRTEPRSPVMADPALDAAAAEALEAHVALVKHPGPGAHDVPGLVGGAPAASTVARAPAFTLQGPNVERYNQNPGPGHYTYGVYEPLNGLHHIVTETTLGRTTTMPSSPVPIMVSREPAHAPKAVPPQPTAPDKGAYREDPDRWTRRVRLPPGRQEPTEMRMACYSSFGGQTRAGAKSAAAFTMRSLHINRSRLSGNPDAP